MPRPLSRRKSVRCQEPHSPRRRAERLRRFIGRVLSVGILGHPMRKAWTVKLSYVFAQNAALAFLFGLALVLIPAQLLGWYGVKLDEAGLCLARLFGAS